MNDEYLTSAKDEPAELPPPPRSAEAVVPPRDRGEPPAPASTGASPEPSRAVTAAPAEAARTPSAGPRWLAWVSPVLFVLALLVAFGWWLLGYSPTSAGTQNRIAEIGTLLDGLRQDLEAHAKTKAEQLARLQGTVEEQKRLQEAHGLSIEKLALSATQDSEDLIFAEVAYLLGIAQQRLSFERDVPTAIRAMEAADQRLLNLIRPDLETVRAVLMADLNDLRAVPVIDITGPALYLADVLKRIDTLPFQGGLTRASDEDAGQRAEAVRTPRPPVKSFDEAADRVWNDLIGLVSIKTLGTEDARIFDPNFRKLIEQQLHLEITNARLELSHRNGAAFQATLGVLAGLFERYYDVADPTLTSIQKRLADMRALELSPPIPDVARSIKGLREYVLARRKLAIPTIETPGATIETPGARDDSAATPDASGAEADQGAPAVGPATAEPAPNGDDRNNAPEGAGTVPAPAIGTAPAASPGEAVAPPTARSGTPAADDPKTPDAAP